MKCLKEEDTWIKNGLIRQPVNNQPYRLSTFVVRFPVNDGFLLFNTVTGCILFFENEQDFHNSKETLIQNWFLIPSENFDEHLWVDYLRDKKREIKGGEIKSYLIMTTMGCNARCFYCYEKGRKPISMTEQTAIAVSNMIIADSSSKKVRISWFGGEPLVNSKVINIICKNLEKHNCAYSSNIISNGLLFSEDLIDQAINQWHLQRVQITIDGTEKNYLSIKAYKHGHGDEFQKVMHNIENLLKNNISVSIRLNQNYGNTNDLIILSEYIKDKFAKYNTLSVYNRLLFDEKITDDLYIAYFKLKHKLQKLHLSKPYYGEALRSNQCMADSDTSLVITPNGKIGKCEHFSESNFIGSIYDKEFDQQMISQFKETYEKLPSCNTCAFYPRCVRLKMCPSPIDVCTDFIRADYLDDIHYMMNACYKKYKVSLGAIPRT